MITRISPLVRAVTSALILSITVTGCAIAQSFQCANTSLDDVVAYRNAIVRVVTSTDSTANARRTMYNLPLTTASKVAFVTSTRTCATAAQAYYGELGVAAPTGPVQVIVLKVGSGRYVVTNQSHREGEFNVAVVFDSKWHALGQVSY